MAICLQTTAPVVSVAQVALHYTVNAKMIFKWPRDPKYWPKSGAGSEEAVLRFPAVEIVTEAPVIRQIPGAENHIDIDLARGHRMRINGGMILRHGCGRSGAVRHDPGPHCPVAHVYMRYRANKRV